jgi:hypothetical protein
MHMNRLQVDRILVGTNEDAFLYEHMRNALATAQTKANEYRMAVEEARIDRLCRTIMSANASSEEVDTIAERTDRKLSRSPNNGLVRLFQRRENRRIRHATRACLRWA